MVFRENETEKFPVDQIDKSIWYFIVKNNILEEFKSTITDKKSLIHQIEQLISAKTEFKLCGVWHGEWSTDIFVLDPAISLKLITSEIEKRKQHDKRNPANRK